jgi:hypothetical protein
MEKKIQMLRSDHGEEHKPNEFNFVQIMVLGTNLQNPMPLNKMVFVKGIIAH